MEKIEENEREQGKRKENNYWLEKANESARHFTKQIDWEQRRWELVVSLFVHWNNISDFDGLTSLDIADSLIKGYKKSLNKEE